MDSWEPDAAEIDDFRTAIAFDLPDFALAPVLPIFGPIQTISASAPRTALANAPLPSEWFAVAELAFWGEVDFGSLSQGPASQ